MGEIAIKAEDMRLPVSAREALDHGDRVLITRYGQPTTALLSYESYARVAPLLELMEQGAVISPELLMSQADIALMKDLAQDTENTPAEDALIEVMLTEQAEASAG